MDIDKLSYEKLPPKRGKRVPSTAKVVQPARVPQEAVQIDPASVPSAYQKREGQLDQRLIFVLSGGSKREMYLLHFLPRHSNVKVLFLTQEGQGLLPDKMQDKWLEIQRDNKVAVEGVKYQLADIDYVYLVSDVDEFYDDLKRFIRNPGKGRGQWIVSNPCVEMWLYYCYWNAPQNDLSFLEAEDASTRSQHLKQWLHQTAKGAIDPRKAYERIPEGIQHSKEHYEEDENGIPALYATQMYQLMECIIKGIGDFDALVAQKKAEIGALGRRDEKKAEKPGE